MTKITKSPPWETFYNEVAALFALDNEVHVEKHFTEDRKEIKLRVDNHRKYELLTKYIAPKRDFGAVTVYVTVIDANAPAVKPTGDEMAEMFAGNKAVSRVSTVQIPGSKVTYVAFKNGVVQFFDDNLADINGNATMLMQKVACNVLNVPIDGVYFCTDKPADKTNKSSTKAASKDDSAKNALDDLFKAIGLF